MDKIISLLKVLLLVVAIAVGIGILGLMYFLYKGVRSGDLQGYVQKTAIEQVIDTDKLSPEQKEMLDSGDMEGLVEDLQENVTPEQIDCAVQAVGEERAKELMETQDPTPQELLLLSKCL
ncbi:hypothetical protein C4561_03360 [candidate division WWE3 bacterium]|jgi:nitrogen regulatory protein PII-like uncharacterized protein|uniref:Uncharacterized protein n=1 Tax=candidate division WWE3 bacterium TaxID=2053526 RepID=A0A3A4ZC08_UNCKA|nr:MAG: hypothetical protein C4561_03360 [candidate division WWE3 bacterium]